MLMEGIVETVNVVFVRMNLQGQRVNKLFVQMNVVVMERVIQKHFDVIVIKSMMVYCVAKKLISAQQLTL